MSIISVAGHQVVKNLSEPSEITLVHMDIYADYLREKDPKLDSRAVRALLTTDRRSKAVESGWTLHRGPWPISDSDECGRHQHLHKSSRN